MTTPAVLTPTDPFGRDRARRASGLLAVFNAAGVITAADVHVANRLASLVEEDRDEVLLATALTTRAVRHGSIHLDLRTASAMPLELPAGVVLPWPEPEAWLAAVRSSRLVVDQVLRLEESALYLDRYWREEIGVCQDLLALLARPVPTPDLAAVTAAAVRVLPLEGYDQQRRAAVEASGRALSVLTGGPGTGKTTTVAAVLAVVAEQFEAEHDRLPRIALAAPTGKAAARLQESVLERVLEFGEDDQRRIGTVRATTLHRLLGWIPDSSVRFKHGRERPLAVDLVVVDEASMVSLSMMARLLEALPERARLILVGDPEQLASVEAGAVLADVVRGLELRVPSPVTRLETARRYGVEIGELALALRHGSADEVIDVLTRAHPDQIDWIRPDDDAAMNAFRSDVVQHALRIRTAAEAGDAEAAVAALDDHRLLCAHRHGPYGVSGWNREVEQLLAAETKTHHYDEWYAGRPVIVSANDRSLGLYNGDMGVAIRQVVDGVPRLRVAIQGADELTFFAPTRLPEVQTVHALTVHKAQGSQAAVVSVIMPPAESALLTLELFYTAVTRAEERVRIVGSEKAIRAAVARRVQRASGLAERLSGSQ